MESFCASCGAPYRPDDRFCGKCGALRTAASSPAPVYPAQPVTLPSTPARKPIGAIVGVLVVAVVPVVAFLFIGKGCDSVEGNMAVTSGPHGNFTFTPTGCASMQPYGRFGANLHAEGNNDGAVYVSVDPTRGQSVEIEVPGSCRNADGTNCTVFPVPRDKCRVFDVHVENTGVSVNDVRLVEGRVHLECTLEDGTSVRGRIDFDGC